MGTLKVICRFLVFLGYLISTIGIPIYLSYPLFVEILQDKTVSGFFAYMGYSMIVVLWFFFILTIFGYSVGDD